MDDVVGPLAGVANGLGRVVVKRQVHTRHVGQVGGDVAVGHLHLAVLHVLGVNELDVVDQVQLVEQDGADQSIEIAAGNQTVFLTRP